MEDLLVGVQRVFVHHFEHEHSRISMWIRIDLIRPIIVHFLWRMSTNR